MCRPPGSAAISYNVLYMNAFIPILVPLIMDHESTLGNAIVHLKDTYDYIQIWVIGLICVLVPKNQKGTCRASGRLFYAPKNSASLNF